MSGSPSTPFLAVQIDFRRKFQINALEGVMDQAQQEECLYDIVSLDARSPISPHWSNCRGVLCFAGRQDVRDRLAQLPYPVINMSNALGALPEFGNLLSDDYALGRLAARHLMERGRRSLFGLGLPGMVFSRDRLRGFIAEAEEAGVPVFTQDQPDAVGAIAEADWSPRVDALVQAKTVSPFLANLPPDAGLFGVNDVLAQLLMICLHYNYPERLHTSAVLGVDNDFYSHRLPGESPSLSSIRTAFRRIGAAGLDWFVRHPGGGQREVREVLQSFLPEGVSARASTAGAPCTHPGVSRGMRWAWEQLVMGNPPSVHSLAAELKMSSRTLERLCQKHIGQTAREYLHTLRLDRARQLLREESTLPLAEVGELCGFGKPTHFSFAFKQANGVSPREYRQHFIHPVERSASRP